MLFGKNKKRFDEQELLALALTQGVIGKFITDVDLNVLPTYLALEARESATASDSEVILNGLLGIAGLTLSFKTKISRGWLTNRRKDYDEADPEREYLSIHARIALPGTRSSFEDYLFVERPNNRSTWVFKSFCGSPDIPWDNLCEEIRNRLQ